MNILAINTGEATAQIALLANGKNIYYELNASMKHSENLLPAIEKVLTDAKVALKDLDYLAVNLGPGSFTGLRIAVATAKGLLLTNKNITPIGINTFELMADAHFKNNSAESANFVINGLSGFYFHSTLSKQKEILSEPCMIEKSNLTFNNIVSDTEIENIESKVVKTSCENLLNVALEKVNKKDFCTESELLPLYIRPSQAEYNLLNKNKHF